MILSHLFKKYRTYFIFLPLSIQFSIKILFHFIFNYKYIFQIGFPTTPSTVTRRDGKDPFVTT